MENLSLENVKSYLAAISPEQFVGEPGACCHCLAAETLNYLYPECDPVVAGTDNREAWIKLEGEEVTVEFSKEVIEMANKFDKFPGKQMKNVSKQELQGYMPELFR